MLDDLPADLPEAATEGATQDPPGTPRTARPGGDGHLADEASLRALAHPIRWALLEVLTIEGTATASRCAAVLGHSHGSCSFHLRQLARFGLVEQAPTTSRRERPWRLTTVRQSWSNAPTDDPARDRAAQDLSSVFVQRETDRLRRWAREEQGAPPQWRGAAFRHGTLSWLTPDELDEVGDAIAALLERYVDRVEQPGRRPEGSRPVRLFAAGYPVFDLDPDADPAADGEAPDVGPA